MILSDTTFREELEKQVGETVILTPDMIEVTLLAIGADCVEVSQELTGRAAGFDFGAGRQRFVVRIDQIRIMRERETPYDLNHQDQKEE